jgi:hypothetical protein
VCENERKRIRPLATLVNEMDAGAVHLGLCVTCSSVAPKALICGLLFSKCSAESLWLPSLKGALNRQNCLVADPLRPRNFFVEFVYCELIRLDGNTASARWLLREVGLGPAKRGPGNSYYNFGFFIDELEKVDGKWLFKTRTDPYLYIDTDPFTGKGVALSTDFS